MDHVGLLTVVALVLTAYRITRLIVSDQFPFEPVRTKAVGHPFWGVLLSCPFCVSVWVGGFLAVGQTLVGDGVGWHIFIGAMAMSAVVCILAALLPQLFD